ncbi:MAG: FHA domain-containing protein [Anaerolineales bacterium]|nr:FHA domain-containing protein [Anaerolineales bacterium]
MTAIFVLILRVGLAVALYYFLWRVLQTLWQDLKQQSNTLSSQKNPGIRIDVQSDSGEEIRYNFWQPEILIGRGPHCTITLRDESLSVSHARISFHHAQWWLEDLGSTNGTILNSDLITTPTVVISGDHFKCGNTTFTLRMHSIDKQHPKQVEAGSEGDQ